MADYKTARDAARTITARYEEMLRSLAGDYEDEMVVVSLMNHYSLCLDNNDDTILVAIERVLEDYMLPSYYNAWKLALKNEEKQSDPVADGFGNG